MFSFDIFAEIIVVGGLLFLSLTPLIVRLTPLAESEGAFVPAVDYLKEGTGRFLIALLVAYALGVAGNRLVDNGLDFIEFDSGSEYKQKYENWAKTNNIKPTTLKMAEFVLRERNEATAGWLDRHKSFERILRGAMAACGILLLTMTGYVLSSPSKPRYRQIHFFSVAIFLLIFMSAYHLESSSYKKRVFDLATNLPALKN